SRLEMEVDVKITSFDLSGLRVIPLPPTAQTPKETPKPKAEAPRPKAPDACDEEGGEIVEIVEEWPASVVPFGHFMPPPPPGRNHCFRFFHRHDDAPTGYGYPPPGMGYGWYGHPPMPYGYGGFYYPH